MNRFKLLLASAALAGLMTAPALAQKSEDMVRVAQQEMIGSLDYYLDPRPEVAFVREMVYDTLVVYDYAAREYLPLLAKSWQQIDDTTIEFELRDDVTWHDGEKFDADDVVHTVNYLIDPKVQLRLKRDYAWMKTVEKLGPYKIRLTTTKPTPYALSVLSTQVHIYPEHVHGQMEDKIAFGRKPVGTGPYRAVQVDQNAGIIVEKRDSYPQANVAKPEGTVGRFKIVGIPDAGARLAELMTGNLDISRDIPANQAASMEDREGFDVTLGDTFGVYYILMDAAGRSGIKPLTDERVRRAILMAINREDLRRVLVGKWANEIKDPEALCDPAQVGCEYSAKPPPYDPEKAKELLKEAGYADGFDIQITGFSYLTARMAEAMTGALRELNIRATVNQLTFPAYRDQQREGKQQVLIGGWGGGAAPDVSHTLEFQFSEGDRNYHGNDKFFELVAASNREMDPEKRKELTKQVFDLATEMSYLLPITRYPNLWVHSSDVELSGFDRKPLVQWGLNYDMIDWRDAPAN